MAQSHDAFVQVHMDSPAIRGFLFPVSTPSPPPLKPTLALEPAPPASMLEHIVSRVRRQFRRTHVPQPQPPDLHRWSDFDEPFPPVSPGGYKRYYESHRPPAPAALPSASTTISTSLPTAATTISTAVISSPFKRPPRNPARLGLTVIIEGSEPTRTHARPRTPSAPGVSPTASLRRRRRRLLRTPSVERAFPPSTGSCVSRSASNATSTTMTSSHLGAPMTTTTTTTATLDVSVHPFEGEFGEGDKGDTRSSYWSARSRFSAADTEGAALVG